MSEGRYRIVVHHSDGNFTRSVFYPSFVQAKKGKANLIIHAHRHLPNADVYLENEYGNEVAGTRSKIDA